MKMPNVKRIVWVRVEIEGCGDDAADVVDKTLDHGDFQESIEEYAREFRGYPNARVTAASVESEAGQ